jgi:hypothetical protein
MGSAWPIPCYIVVERVGVKRVVVKVSSWRVNGLIFDNIVNAIKLKGSRKTNQKILLQIKGRPVVGEIIDHLFLHLVLAFWW